jgi:iron complex transport system permease protein
VKDGVSSGRKVLFVLFLLFVIGILIAIFITLGASPSRWEVYTVLLNKLFSDHYFEPSPIAEAIVWDLRMPQILLGIGTGFTLGLAGGMLQWALRNSLASPYTLGISSAAVFGAALVPFFSTEFPAKEVLMIGSALTFALIVTLIILGLSTQRWATSERIILAGIGIMIVFGTMTIVALSGGKFDLSAVILLAGFTGGYMSFIPAIIATFIILALSRKRFVTPEQVILTGIGMMLLLGTITTLICFVGKINLYVNQDAALWMLGCLGRASWTHVYSQYTAFMCIIVLLFLILLFWLIGVNPKYIRISTIVIASFLIAIAVCFTGTIAFIGLIAPHISRVAIGEDHRFVIPTSALLGVVLFLGATMIARTVIAPVIIPVGIITTLMGAPLFIYLIITMAKEGEVTGEA